jgi:hypothetical protein
MNLRLDDGYSGAVALSRVGNDMQMTAARGERHTDDGYPFG